MGGKLDNVTEFDAVFMEILRRLYTRLTALAGSPAAADDLVQDVYVRLRATERRARRFVEHPNPYGYALATAINLARRQWRSQLWLRPLDDAATPVDDGGLDQAEAHLDTLRMLRTLTAKEAAVVILVDLDGLTLDEAAALLGVHKGTAQRNRLRALTKLRERLMSTVNGGNGVRTERGH